MSKWSQNDEQAIIAAYFGEFVGRFLDIGAYGAQLSNTLGLVEQGWSGVCVEPSPGPLANLMRLHVGKPVELVQAAVGEESGWQTFHDAGGDAVSTLDVAHLAKWQAGSGCKFQPFHVHTVTLGQLFGRFGFDFDFLSLDVEGTNWRLFQLLPFADLSKLRMVCVEHDTMIEPMRELIEPFGFQPVSLNAENLLLAKPRLT